MFNNKSTKPADSKQALPAATLTGKVSPLPEPVSKKPAPIQNLIGAGTVIEGNLTAEGDIEMAGKVTGDVTTKAKLVIAESAWIEGNITAECADIAGTVHGTVSVSGLLTIRTSSKINGDVITKNLNVESGSMFTGRFHVGSTAAKTNAVAPPARNGHPVSDKQLASVSALD
jgi:cytoskeletal protein CcmA (bactofilin family)